LQRCELCGSVCWCLMRSPASRQTPTGHGAGSGCSPS